MLRWLEQRGWSQAQIAGAMNVSQTLVSTVLQHGGSFQVERVRSLALAANTSLPTLLRAIGGRLESAHDLRGRLAQSP